MITPLQIERITGSPDAATVAQLAEIHQAEIGSGFLTSLGPKVLGNLYSALSQSEHVRLFVAKQDERIVGFICGAVDTRLVYHQVLWRHALRDVFVILPRVITWRRLKSIYETVRYPRRQMPVELPRAEILNFCVRHQVQRSGVGRRLFRALVDEFHASGVDRMRIVTGAGQTQAQRFYESLGARHVTSFELHEGIESMIYTFDVSTAAVPTTQIPLRRAA